MLLPFPILVVVLALPVVPETRVIMPLNDPAELRRLRTEICEAWTSHRTLRIFASRSVSVDASASWKIQLGPDSEGRMIASVTTETSDVPVPFPDDPPPPGPDPPNQFFPRDYDALEFLMPDGSPVAPGTAVDCKAVGEGRFIPQLRYLKTGRALKW